MKKQIAAFPLLLVLGASFAAEIYNTDALTVVDNVRIEEQEAFHDSSKYNLGLNNEIEFGAQDSSSRSLSNDCRLDQDREFSSKVILDLVGRPDLLTTLEKTKVGTLFMEAYNELVDCNTNGNFRQIESITSSYASFANYGVTKFSLEYEVEGNCRGCSKNTRLFSYTERNGIVRDTCPCQKPSIFTFRLLLQKKVEAMIAARKTANIESFVGASELEETPSCPSYTEFTSYAIVRFVGCSSTIQPADLQTLGEKFRRTYNKINGRNAALCDRYFRRIDEAIPASGIIVTSTTANRRMAEGSQELQIPGRTLQQESCQDHFQVRFEVTGRCRDCDGLSMHLFDAEDAVNFFESYDDDLYMSGNVFQGLTRSLVHDDYSSEGEQAIEEKISTHDYSRDLKSSECYCPLDAKFRAVTECDMRTAYNLVVSAAYTSSVTDVIEVEPVDCAADMETFETSITVEYEVDTPDGVVPPNVVEAQIQQLQLTYNHLQDRYCDPYFREVTSVTVSDDTSPIRRRHRSLQTTVVVRYKYTVVGKCRGCSKVTPLLKNDAVKRRLEEDSVVLHGKGDVMKRRLQDSEPCFCAIANVANSAPTPREYLVSYNIDISVVVEEIVATQIVEEVGDDVDDDEDVSDSRRECTEDFECLNSQLGDICVNFECIYNGNPRITLTWEGDDDLDLYVTTPDGNTIDWYYDFDESSGGTFDTQFSQEGFGPHVESVYFPLWGGPSGTYILDISTWYQGIETDDWKLEVFTLESGLEPAMVFTGSGDAADLTFDFGDLSTTTNLGVCTLKKYKCCVDSDCATNMRCANRNCVTRGARSATLTWVGNDDHDLVVFTPDEQLIYSGSWIDPTHGAVFEDDVNGAVTTNAYHAENLYFPTGRPGGLYYFMVEVFAQRNLKDRWTLKVIEFGDTILEETGFGVSQWFNYTATECRSNSHCPSGTVCIVNFCIDDGSPRFTLTWRGDDDLDLGVVPPLGNKIDYWNRFDSQSGGTLTDDRNPNGPVHVESVNFGVSQPALTGRYNLHVRPYEVGGGSNDTWTLRVSVKRKVVKTWKRRGEAWLRYWF